MFCGLEHVNETSLDGEGYESPRSIKTGTSEFVEFWEHLRYSSPPLPTPLLQLIWEGKLAQKFLEHLFYLPHKMASVLCLNPFWSSCGFSESSRAKTRALLFFSVWIFLTLQLFLQWDRTHSKIVLVFRKLKRLDYLNLILREPPGRSRDGQGISCLS